MNCINHINMYAFSAINFLNQSYSAYRTMALFVKITIRYFDDEIKL